MGLEVDLWGLVLVKHRPRECSSFSLGRDVISRGFRQLMGVIFTAIDFMRGKVLPGHYVLIPNFVNVVRNGEKPLVTAEEGRDVARILEKITKQIDDGTGR